MNDASSPTVALSACRGVETVVSLDGGSASWAGGSATERGFELGEVIIRVTHRDRGETLHPAAAGLQRGRGAAGREGDQPVPGRADLRRVLRGLRTSPLIPEPWPAGDRGGQTSPV